MTRDNSNSYDTTDVRTTTTSISPTIPENAGITRTEPGASAGRVVLTGHNTITEVWQGLVADPEIRDYLVIAARKAVVGLDRDEVEKFLDSLRITNTPQMHHYPEDLILDLRWSAARAKESGWELSEIAPELGTGSSSVEDIISIGRLFQFVHHQNPHLSIDTETLTITVEIEYEKFKGRSRTQRTNVCRLLHVLSKAFDIRLAVSQNTQAFLKQFHREDLPCVSEWSIIQRGGTDTDEVLVKLDPYGTSTKILKALDQEPDGTLSYSELYEFVEKSASRVRQCVSKLREYGLITSFGSQNNKKVTQLDPGAEVLDNLQQQSEQRCQPYASPDPTPNSERQRRECASAVRWRGEGDATGISREEGRRPGAADRPAPQRTAGQESPTGYSTGRMCPSMRDAAAACGDEQGAVTIVDDGIDHIDSSLQLFAVDELRKEVVISSYATTPVDYTVGSAMALAHPKLIREVLDETTLTTILDNTPAEILSWARQIAYVPLDEVEAPAFQDALLSWRSKIGDLTLVLKRNDYESAGFDCRNDLLSEILRQAHGLTGCVVHLLDEAGFDVIRDFRIPSGLNSSKIEALAESIAHSITVQSRYKSFSAYRQLFESRERHRSNSFTVEVDAADPYGSLIGSLVLRGGCSTQLKPALTNELKSYEPHKDAPEFAIPITIREVTRDAIASATERVLERKNIRMTEGAVSVLNTVVGSPFRVTRALSGLCREPDVRNVESADLRFALQQLSADDVMSEAPRSVGKIMMTLLEATEPVTQSELAERAGVTGQTIRNRSDELTETGLVQWEREPSGVKKWRVRTILLSDSRTGDESKEVILLGSRPKQTAIGDAGQIKPVDSESTDTENSVEHNDGDDDEVDVDFSDVSIRGSPPPTEPEDVGLPPEGLSQG